MEKPTSETLDRFEGPDEASLLAGSVRVPAWMDVNRWLSEVMPPRQSGPWGSCIPNGRSFESERWQNTRIGGRSAWWRSACGYVDGVVFVRQRAYVFIAHGEQTKFSTAPQVVELFDAFVATVKFRLQGIA